LGLIFNLRQREFITVEQILLIKLTNEYCPIVSFCWMFREVSHTQFEREKSLIREVDGSNDVIGDEEKNYNPGYKVVKEFSGSFPFIFHFSKNIKKERSLIW
jgi:hypothetical protein